MSGQNVSSTAEAYAFAADAGIHPLVLPTPFGVGPVNTYLVEDDPLTLVDCGPNVATGLGLLERLLAERGHTLADLELVVVTHQHIDHTGLARAIAERTDVEVACLDALAPVLRRWDEHGVLDDDDARRLMLDHGVEPHVADALRAVADVVRGYGCSAPVHRPLRDGEQLALRDRTFTVLHRPGHSPSDIVLLDAEREIALTGDHLLSGVSSNAVITRPLGEWDGRRPEPLLQYRASLQATRELPFELGLGGHGGPVTGHRELIAERLLAQERRAAHFHDLLAERPLSAHELATARWGPIAITQAFLTLSEVLGHLGLLIADGVVAEDRSGAVIRFQRI
ncbi:MBL fold metallo-hydrolase [Conexibacter stalactiti]|uniref:MBL fold metallo-hydrolase n=1 Tax=Conexibacter stalactiti TaxID=1940611 RepID=A0ABU4HIT0_9ACTN|nr:MBL fold metallo-hydrolase [Conexibacter stalactiti]MDW5593160.1 MBL fold metallo-hydrolase [Conexibacter stalactiti]MEC5033801.1 MBL fold metallo-hydrolase [Conexibacter stalactiti]